MYKKLASRKSLRRLTICWGALVSFAGCGGLSSLPAQIQSIAGGTSAGNVSSSVANLSQATASMTFSDFLADSYLAPLCPNAAPAGYASCGGYMLTPAGKQAVYKSTSAALRFKASSAGLPNGWGPSDFQSAYGLTSFSSTLGGGESVAIVIPGHWPALESDLGVYRSTYSLPACTTANGCFKEFNQTGGTTYTTTDLWDVEKGIDVDMVSAICPHCNIWVVEANSAAMSDLAAAENTAASLKPAAISNSWGGSETGMASYASAFNHPGIPITAAAGTGPANNEGFSSVQEVPAAYSTVIAAGGTNLLTASNARGFNDYLWMPVINGCSTITAKPSWQHDTGCSTRTVSDISFAITGMASYSSYNNTGWWTLFGDSSAPPAIAAIAAMAGTQANNASFLYTSKASAYLTDVTLNGAPNIGAPAEDGVVNSNGTCAVPGNYSSVVEPFSAARGVSSRTMSYPSYLCTAVVGYDAPTGVGTPYGIGAFITNTPAPSTPTPTASSCPVSSGTPNPHPTQNVSAPNGCTGS